MKPPAVKIDAWRDDAPLTPRPATEVAGRPAPDGATIALELHDKCLAVDRASCSLFHGAVQPFPSAFMRAFLSWVPRMIRKRVPEVGHTQSGLEVRRGAAERAARSGKRRDAGEEARLSGQRLQA